MLVPLFCALPVLAWTFYSDLRWMRIGNRAVLLVAAMFVAGLPLLGPQEALLRLAAAAAVFAVFFALFAAGAMGGGDVKLVSAIMLVVPSAAWTLYALVLAVSLLAGIVLVTGLRAIPRMRATGWPALVTPGAFPMGISLSTSAALLAALLAGAVG